MKRVMIIIKEKAVEVAYEGFPGDRVGYVLLAGGKKGEMWCPI